MKKLIVIVLALCFFSPVVAFADGGIFYPDDEWGNWDMLKQNKQEAYINFYNGREELLLSIDVGANMMRESLWLLPVPARPDEIILDVIDGIPAVTGDRLKKKIDDSIAGIEKTLWMTQLYPVVPLLISNFTVGHVGAPLGDLGGPGTGVTVHQRLEKKGIISEVLTAQSGQALADYLIEKNFRFDIDGIPRLNEYIGDNFSFIASWLTPKPQEDGNRGLFISFPAQEIFYPMKLTSLYRETPIPVVIRVMGLVTPDIYKDIKPYAQLDYFIIDKERDKLDFFQGPAPEYYTLLRLNAQAKYYTQDLIFRPGAAAAERGAFLVKYSLFFGLLFLIIFSVLASLAAAWFLFKDSRSYSGSIKYAVLGLGNLLTLLGLFIITLRIRSEKKTNKENGENPDGSAIPSDPGQAAKPGLAKNPLDTDNRLAGAIMIIGFILTVTLTASLIVNEIFYRKLAGQGLNKYNFGLMIYALAMFCFLALGNFLKWPSVVIRYLLAFTTAFLLLVHIGAIILRFFFALP